LENLVSSIKSGVGRKRINDPDEQVMARFPKGTLDRIKTVLAEKEPQAALIREAVERELTRREQLQRQRDR
jgi:hypothetical protein